MLGSRSPPSHRCGAVLLAALGLREPGRDRVAAWSVEDEALGGIDNASKRSIWAETPELEDDSVEGGREGREGPPSVGGGGEVEGDMEGKRAGLSRVVYRHLFNASMRESLERMTRGMTVETASRL